MKSKHIIALAVVVFLAGFIYISLSQDESADDYNSAILKEREEKNAFMKTDKTSPFQSAIKNELDKDTAVTTPSFTKLNYFEPDIKYKVKASLEPIENKKVVTLPTSDGKEKRYLEYAFANFKLEDQENRLLILEVMDSGPYKGTLFLSFADATSAYETYGAGRYLELKKVPAATSIILDFNKAYNPYCAYSDVFSCPFPPPQNILKIAIKAGEMKYHD